MTTCPKCGTALKDEYGMSQCLACGTLSFIDMDGNAVIQESTIEAEDAQPFDSFAAMPSMDAPYSPDTTAPQEFASVEFESLDMNPVSDSSLVSDLAPSESAIEAIPENRAVQAFGPANDPLNLNEFANSEVSSAKDGPLLFRVLISGIDAKEIRDSIREVLEDPRFAWDSNEIFSKVSKGHLAINDLSPVKASILVTRLKRLPIQIRWEQYAIAQGQT